MTEKNENAGASAGNEQNVAKRKKHWLRPVLLLAGPLAVIIGGAYWYYSGGRFVGTENAYIHADMVAISPQIDGPISEILIHENQRVEKGDVLFRIDPRPYQIAVERAHANLAATAQEIEALKQSYEELQGSLELAKINLDFAKKKYDRQAALRKSNVASQASFDEAQNALLAAKQRIVLDQRAMKTTLAKLGGNYDTPITDLPQYQQAKYALDQAELDLAHTEITAPFRGVISNKPEEGAYAKAGQAMASLVSSDAVWIDANFKEVDLTYLEPGQEAEISVDAYPGKVWHGVVHSVAPATGAEFSVIPAQNATGNWVKVVQRVPVRIAVDIENGGPELRAGMSTEIEVDTHHKRELPAFAAAALGWIGINQAEAGTEGAVQ
ncbi:HlyD family secretion protein [Thalassospira sp. A3_1]|uniref:HlyD family secretion protein n=1 Tax=Thalassospira sp. A3_1 TaxID=2821088 RepID=UPI001ADBAD36|nr:HlyD family secretion protein [Thalassospira sp. A3_1]MBO9509154.1 HlyD family secretion protein [Thalassospira sp. A3_1]